ncbi:MAG: hypothetical protein KatS3mg121_1064 [Gammaproteobacteria bacterium]|nr:MAG: hypothetical protein KatS3mg121_1064 [Gammaproteobacteria bacterium]
MSGLPDGLRIRAWAWFWPVPLTALVLAAAVYAAAGASPMLAAGLAALLGAGIVAALLLRARRQDRAAEKLRALSIVDDLTDVYNRRFFLEQAERELAKAQRYGTPFALVAVTVDGLKHINERHGQRAGDAVLQAVANTCLNELRAMDIVARMGGAEFMCLLPESDKIDLVAFASRLLDALEETVVAYGGEEIRFSASIGVKTAEGEGVSLDALLAAATDAVAEAKRRGGGCIVVCDAVGDSTAF